MKSYAVKTIKAGQFSEVIEIQTRSATVDGYNVPVESFATTFTLRAQYVPQTVISKFTANKEAVINRALFRIRRDPGISPVHFVRYRNQMYGIKGVQKIGRGVGTFVEIIAEKVA